MKRLRWNAIKRVIGEVVESLLESVCLRRERERRIKGMRLRVISSGGERESVCARVSEMSGGECVCERDRERGARER